MKKSIKITIYIILLFAFGVILRVSKNEFNIDLSFHILLFIIGFNHKKIFNFLFN
jgi:hypothetical protein